MSALSRPIGTLLDADVDAATIRGMWMGSSRRRQERQRARHLRALVGSFVVGVISALCVVALVGRAPRTAPVAVPVVRALELAGGGAFGTLEAAEASREIAFDDGSRIELAKESSLRALENNDHALVLHLAKGSARFDVHAGGPRRWTIEAGLATVEVVGTRFLVARSAGDVIVEVDHGVVLVRGEQVPDRVRRLEAGERLVVGAVPPESITAAPGTAVARETGAAPAPSSEPAWHALAERGAYAQAYDSLGAQGIAARVPRADLEQLLALADVARLSGHPAEAVEPLRRIVSEHASDSRAALAAFTLGRLHLDELGSPAAAARDFRQAITLKLPGALIEDAYLRWLEAAAKAGDAPAVREAYGQYRARFPNSTRGSAAERWAGQR